MDRAPSLPLLLASNSPRRAALLRQIGLHHFETLNVDVDESGQPNETPSDLALRLALAKAQAGAARSPAGTLVLGADTVVSLQGRVYGQPADANEVMRTLRALAGRVHEVTTAVCAVRDGLLRTRVCVSHVAFRHLTAREIRAYAASGEPYGKAGSYAVQGLAAAFIRGLEGSYSGVMGLPLYETCALLKEFGLDPLHYQAPPRAAAPQPATGNPS